MMGHELDLEDIMKMIPSHKSSLNQSKAGEELMDNLMREAKGKGKRGSNDTTSHTSSSTEDGGWKKKLYEIKSLEKRLGKIKLIIPHVTLVLATVLYMILGASVFYYIERPNEERVKTMHKQRVRQLREELLEEAWQMGMYGSGMDEHQFFYLVGTRIDDIINETLRSFAQGVTADALNNQEDLTMQWTYPSAIFFSTTVITTIGYGHLVPVTLWGRLVCIVYALLGIPLALVTTADIGKFVSMGLTNLYDRYRQFKEEKLCPKKGVKHMLAQMHGGIVPRRDEKKKSSDKEIKSKFDLDLEKNGEVKKAPSAPAKPEEDNMDDEESDEAPVPPSLLLVLLLSFTAANAWLFTQWEGWNFLTSFYFCFITMITVGFGDLFPTKEAYLLPAICFIFTGLILTTMCIDLVGTHYIRRIHFFGRKIQSARDMFAAMGIPDWLKQKGFNETHLRNMMLNRRIAFMPDDLDLIRYIDQKLSSTDEDISLLSSGTLSSRVFKSTSKDVHDVQC